MPDYRPYGEAVLRVVSLEAAEDLRRLLDAARAGPEPADGEAPSRAARLVVTPDRELVRLGLISNRGFIVVAAVVGVLSQGDWWNNWVRDGAWSRYVEAAREDGPGWLRCGWPDRGRSPSRCCWAWRSSCCCWGSSGCCRSPGTWSATGFDRRAGMAMVSVDTAGAGGLGHRVQIPFLDARVAAATLRRLYAEGCATEFRW